MAVYTIKDTTLTAIADAIREKTGGTGTIKPGEMATEISNISGEQIEPIVLSGDCKYACSGRLGQNYIERFGNTISTSGITNANSMFAYNNIEKIPFTLNFGNPSSSSACSLSTLFYRAYGLKELPPLNLMTKVGSLNYLFQECYNLKKLPDNFGMDWDWSFIHTNLNTNLDTNFQSCYSLRSIPESFLNNLWGNSNSRTYSQFNYSFYNCYSLDEIKGLRFNKNTITSNMFYYTFNNCCRIKDIMFALEEDGSVQTINCKSQTIDLSTYVGYLMSYGKTYILNYNSGITADKEVKDDATYQALKDDPDYWTMDINYSRYNHNSAVRTINSLPDTSAYLATAGGTNTIKFKGASGSKTDGGAINTLTEEEIAVATAKGWTVSLV